MDVAWTDLEADHDVSEREDTEPPETSTNMNLFVCFLFALFAIYVQYSSLGYADAYLYPFAI